MCSGEYHSLYAHAAEYHVKIGLEKSAVAGLGYHEVFRLRGEFVDNFAAIGSRYAISRFAVGEERYARRVYINTGLVVGADYMDYLPVMFTGVRGEILDGGDSGHGAVYTQDSSRFYEIVLHVDDKHGYIMLLGFVSEIAVAGG